MRDKQRQQKKERKNGKMLINFIKSIPKRWKWVSGTREIVFKMLFKYLDHTQLSTDSSFICGSYGAKNWWNICLSAITLYANHGIHGKTHNSTHKVVPFAFYLRQCNHFVRVFLIGLWVERNEKKAEKKKIHKDKSIHLASVVHLRMHFSIAPESVETDFTK